jgi:uncharacterized protein (TIGR03083 family)
VVGRAGFVETLDAIAATWDGWIEVGRPLADERWRAPTRCPGWDVAAVYAHVSVFPTALAGPVPQVPADAGDIARMTAVDILRGFNQPGGVAETMADTVADAAVQDAATHTRDTVISRFSRDGREALARIRTADPATSIPWPGSRRLTTLAEALRIVLMESVVHLLDVLRALDLPPRIPDPALRGTVQLLSELASAVDFVEAATGRSATSPLPVLR